MNLRIAGNLDESKFAGKTGVFLLTAAVLILLMAIVAAAAFLLSVRGPEQTMVPNVTGKDIIEALIEMQQKELYPRIQLRFSQSSQDKNKILEQDPHPGAIVKAGRRIRLVVSQGVQVSRIENYVGRTLADVQTEFSTLISGGDAPLLSIKEPVMFEESSKDAGTILEQTPAPGTGISGPAALSFVVSRGKDEGAVMPTLIGLDVDAALAEINNAGIQARFAVRDASARQTPGTVVSQNPAGGIIIAKNTPAEITVAAPAGGQLAEDEVFLLFTRDLPAHPFPVATTLEILNADGSRTQLAEMNHLGGQFTFPCRVKRGGALILSMLGSEVYRQPVD